MRSTSSRKRDAAGAPPIAGGAAPLLLYDGRCGFCAASVQFILRHERRRTLRFAALDSAIGAAVRARHPRSRDVDSMIWVEGYGTEGERVRVRSGAALSVAAYLGGPWRLAAAARMLPGPLRDAVYDLVARHRHRIMASAEGCPLPSPELRARMVE